MTTSPGNLASQLTGITDLLLGVAHADADFDPAEADTIRETLRAFAHLDELSDVIEARMADFDPGSFDLDAAVAAISFHGRSDRRLLLELVVEVLDADAIRDQREESYFYQVAEALGLADIADAVLAGPAATADDEDYGW